MRLSAPSSHLGCAAACAALDPAGKASLACIQSVADEQLAAIAAPAGLNAQIWLGEYQWPMEPVIDFQTIYDCQVFNQSCDKPYKGQKNWGRCTNGQTTNVTNMFLPPFQPNNYNGGEDCMVRTAFGYADNVCNEVHPCLCEWPSQTSAEYVNLIGPALAERGVEAFAMQQTKASFYFTLALILAALPAVGLVLFVEGYFIRWKLRTAPKNDQEMKLQASQRLALRRRMLQSGLALWLGCSLLALSYVPERLSNEASWPIYGFGARSQDVPWGYPNYYQVEHSIWGSNALGYDASVEVPPLTTHVRSIRMLYSHCTSQASRWRHCPCCRPTLPPSGLPPPAGRCSTFSISAISVSMAGWADGPMRLSHHSFPSRSLSCGCGSCSVPFRHWLLSEPRSSGGVTGFPAGSRSPGCGEASEPRASSRALTTSTWGTLGSPSGRGPALAGQKSTAA